MDEDDFDTASFDEAYSESDFGENQAFSDSDRASLFGGGDYVDTGLGDDISYGDTVRSILGGSNVGTNRTNITNVGSGSNLTYDPLFAAALDISRGLDPTNNMGGTGGLAVPSSLRPQVPGNLVLNEAGDRMMYGSGLERFAQETLPPMIQSAQKLGIGGLLDSITSSFTDAKNALGKMGDAVAGFTLPELTGIFSTQTGQKTVNDMEDNVSFDASGNRIELASLPQKGADFLPTAPTNPIFSTSQVNRQQLDSMNRGGTGFATAAGSLFPRTVENSPNFSVPGEENLGMTIDRTGPNTYNLNSRDADFAREMNQLTPSERSFLTERTNTINRPDDFKQLADAGTFNILQGLGTKFNPEVNRFLQQNISPNLRFDTNPRRDPDDPNKLMPFMGLEYRFTA